MAVIFRASATPDLKAVPLAQRFGFLPAVLGAGAADLLELLLRKSAHAISFGLLALLARSAFAGRFPRASARQLAWAAFAFTVLYAASDEWHQSFVPTREAHLTDVLIDAAGAFMMLSGQRLHGLAGKRAHHL